MQRARPSSRHAVYVISVAAELAGVHPQTLRIYERKGLVDPARTPGGSRRYSDADIALLRRIQELTNEGLNLAGVQRVLALEEENRRLRDRARAGPAPGPGRGAGGRAPQPLRPRPGPPGRRALRGSPPALSSCVPVGLAAAPFPRSRG